MFLDVDDILLPQYGETYKEEFSYLLRRFPLASSFSYRRYNVDFLTGKHAALFNICKDNLQQYDTTG